MTHPYTLKHLDRAGWIRAGIHSPESVASHSWGVGYLVLLSAPDDLDLTKLLAMAVVHDLPEIVVGDITPHDGISKAEKHQREQDAAHEILNEKMLELWIEYNDKKTPEAQYLSLLDKVDMAIQAQVYSKTSNTEEFISSCKKHLNKYIEDVGPIPKGLKDILCEFDLFPSINSID